MEIHYKLDREITVDEFIDILRRSSLGARRPINDLECMKSMLNHGNLLVTAWNGASLVGVARSLTDYTYACYMSELAVDEAYQRMGIGKALIEATLTQLGPKCKLRLIAAPAARDYYRKVGFQKNENCWEIVK